MFRVEIDKAQRTLVIAAAGDVTLDEAERLVEDVRVLAERLQPGFRLLTDYRWLESMPEQAAPFIADVMRTLAAKGVGLVVRVIPDPHKDIGLAILSHFHYGPAIKVITLETLADALPALCDESGEEGHG